MLLGFILFSAKAQSNKIDSLKKSLQNAPSDPLVRVDILTKIAEAYLLINSDTALVFGQQGLQLATANRYEAGSIKCLNRLGEAWMLKGNYAKALQTCNQARQRAIRHAYPLEIAYGYNLAGKIYRKQADYSQALKYFFKFLETSEKSNDQDGIGRAFNNIGLIYREQKNDKLALEYFQKSLAIQQKQDNPRIIAATLGNVASIHLRQGNDSLAMYYYQESLKLAQASGSKLYEAIDEYGLGLVYHAQKQYQTSIIHYQKALQLAEKLGEKSEMARYWIGLAESYRQLNAWQPAEEAALRGLQLAQTLGNQKEVQQAGFALAAVYKQRKNFEKALFYHELASSVKDSLFNLENAKIVQNLTFDYQTEKQNLKITTLNKDKLIQQNEIHRKSLQRNASIIGIALALGLIFLLIRNNARQRKSNALLHLKSREIAEKNQEMAQINEEFQQQNESIQLQNQRLEELNQIKDKLFSIISHDIRGPLRMLLGVLSLLEDDDLSKEEVHLITQKLKDNTIHLSDFLDNLLAWARCQMDAISTQPEELSLAAVASENIALLKPIAEKKKIQLQVSIESAIQVLADRESLNIVLRNLIANAIKFTPENGMVTIQTRTEEGCAIISVQDNGMGIPQEDQHKLFGLGAFTTAGTNNEKGTGLGLLLCKDFVEKNGGRIWVESELNRGTTFKFTLPLTEKAAENTID